MAKKAAQKKSSTTKKAAKKTAVKKAPAKKAAPAPKKVAKKAPAKKAPAKKAPAKKAPAKKAPAKKAPAKKAPAKKAPVKVVSKALAKKKPSVVSKNGAKASPSISKPVPKKPVVLDAFEKAQYQRLLDLRDSMVDAMAGVAMDNLGSRANNDASAFGMHQADAGSDAYDRDFALSLLSQEQDALYEIDEAIKRVEQGCYGLCEVSGKKIPKARLEAIPFARLTVECQAELEKSNFGVRGARRNVRSLFGLMDDESEVASSDD
jgi:RNA polymerase-binding transcription factor DksA